MKTSLEPDRIVLCVCNQEVQIKRWNDIWLMANHTCEDDN